MSDETNSGRDVEEKPADSTKPARNRLRLIIPIVLVLGAAGVAIWYFFLRPPAVPPNLIEISGRIETDDSAVAAKTSGRIREITVREGDTVKAGQVIATLDDDQLMAREEQAQAVVTQSETRITRAREQIGVLQEQLNQSSLSIDQARLDAEGRVRQAEAQVLQAEAQLAQAEATYEQTKYDLEKFTRLFKTGDVPERQLNQARTANESQAKVIQAQRRQVDSFRGALTAAKGNLANPRIRTSQAAAIRKQIAQADEDVHAAELDGDRARAQLREAQANRKDLNVIAPFDGTVATRSAEPGEVIAPGTAIITLIDPGQIYLRAFVPEGDIGRLKVGQPARVYLDSNPTQPIDAEVSRIDPEASFTPENIYFRDERVKQVVGIKLLIKNPQGFAKPGMPADGEILVEGNWPGNVRQTKAQ
jgi:HlyD family secretion protein